ncbi:MAG TPA: DUF2252 family protein [Steroidobacteraceae bacterium]|jgi:hypothetical protein
MNAVECTHGYEQWLAQRLSLIKADIRLKHRRMEQDPFFFLRATFYRWAQLWSQQCASLRTSPRVLGVGDLHVENFGTWRDGEGRLIWGINDFDEATTLPYANDLVRLCTSALMAIGESRLATPARLACESVLEGYLQSLKAEGAPVVLAERHRWLRDLAVSRLKEQRSYWERLLSLQPVRRAVPARVRRLLRAAMPERGVAFRIVHRQAGLGSLGRQRYTALAHWRGGTIAREVKPLVASSWSWMHEAGVGRLRYMEIIRRAVRVPDPFLSVRDGRVVRRLAPDCSRIELQSVAGIRDECRLLWMMGWETGNVHLGTPRQRKVILQDLARSKPDWLLKAARRMREATLEDWRQWCEG